MRSFPAKSNASIRLIEQDFYQNLAHVIVESALVFNLNRQKLDLRVKVLNPELFTEMAAHNVSALCIGGHIANWEWAGMSIGNASPMHNVAVYLPLSNRYFNSLMQKARYRITKLDSLVPSRDIFRSLLKAPRPFQTYIIADQSPSRENHHRVMFLGQSTAFFNGPAKMAKKLKIGMIYIEPRRIRNGFYEVELKLLFKDPLEFEEHEITALYAKHLENTILANPSDWLWSHKRWKF